MQVPEYKRLSKPKDLTSVCHQFREAKDGLIQEPNPGIQRILAKDQDLTFLKSNILQSSKKTLVIETNKTKIFQFTKK